MKITNDNGSVGVGEQEFKALLSQLVKQFKFLNDNKPPESIILPQLEEVDGVPIYFEEQVATVAGIQSDSEPEDDASLPITTANTEEVTANAVGSGVSDTQ